MKYRGRHKPSLKRYPTRPPENRRRGAVAPLREAAAIPGAPAEVWFFLGESLAGYNSPAAREAYGRYLELAPQGTHAAVARRATGN